MRLRYFFIHVLINRTMEVKLGALSFCNAVTKSGKKYKLNTVHLNSCHKRTLFVLKNGSDKYFSKLSRGQTKDPKFREFVEEGRGGKIFM